MLCNNNYYYDCICGVRSDEWGMYYIWRTWIGHSNNIIVQYRGIHKGNLTPIEFPL